MPVLEDVPVSTLDKCLRAIVACGVTEMELDYLASVPHCRINSDQRYHAIVESASRKLLDAAARRQIKRWDFDPNDIGHKGQELTELRVDWSPPERWSGDSKRKVVYGAVGCYRRLCHELTERLIARFRNAADEKEVLQVLEEAKTRGVFVEEGISFYHNHSILDSRKVWAACQAALSATKPRQAPEPAEKEVAEEAREEVPDRDSLFLPETEKARRCHSFYKKQKKNRKGVLGLADEE